MAAENTNTHHTGRVYIGHDGALYLNGGTFVGSTADLMGFYGATPVDKPAALTAQLTTLVPADAAGTPDYAIAAVTNTGAYGFASAAEAITTLYVIANLQTRLAEVEARLVELGLITAAG